MIYILNSIRYAELLAGQEGFEFYEVFQKEIPFTFFKTIAVRTRIIDDIVHSTINEEKNIKQLVILGAGMDTRGIINCPNTKHWIELIYSTEEVEGTNEKTVVFR